MLSNFGKSLSSLFDIDKLLQTHLLLYSCYHFMPHKDRDTLKVLYLPIKKKCI